VALVLIITTHVGVLGARIPIHFEEGGVEFPRTANQVDIGCGA
jgi:hypothetical protein